MKLVDTDALVVTEAFSLMQNVMTETYPQFVVDWPKQIESAADLPYVGCYGPLCKSLKPEDLSLYTPENAPEFTVYINKFIPNRQWLILVIAHELSHHVMLLNGYGVESHHSLMCPLDKIYARRLGISPDNLHAGCS